MFCVFIVLLVLGMGRLIAFYGSRFDALLSVFFSIFFNVLSLGKGYNCHTGERHKGIPT